MGSKNEAPPPPNYNGLAAASERTADLSYRLGQQQLQWSKDRYRSDRDFTNRVTSDLFRTMAENRDMALEDRERYERTYQPLEDVFIRNVSDYADKLAASRDAAISGMEGAQRRYEREAGRDLRETSRDMERSRREYERGLAGVGREFERGMTGVGRELERDERGMLRDIDRYGDREAKRFERDIARAERLGEREGELESGQAMATVAQQYEGQREAAMRQLEGYGINPSATRYAGMALDIRNAQATAQAAAGNIAREVASEAERDRQIELSREERAMRDRTFGSEMALREKGMYAGAGLGERGVVGTAGLGERGVGTAAQMRGQQIAVEQAIRSGIVDKSAEMTLARIQAGRALTEADQQNIARLMAQGIDIGRGYPSQIAQSYGTGSSAGLGAVDARLNTTQTGTAGRSSAIPWFGQGTAALGTAGSLQNTGFQNQLAAAEFEAQPSPWLTGFGQIAGTAAGIYAGKKWGQHGGPVYTEESPSRGAIPDDVPAQLTAGEFIVPRDVVEWYGQKHFATLADKARKERSESAIPTR